jgi:hypothetical protein
MALVTHVYDDRPHFAFRPPRSTRAPSRVTDAATDGGSVNCSTTLAPGATALARAKSKLARLIYPDYVGGLYTPDELREVAEISY